MTRKALIVEGEDASGQLLADHLQRWGFEAIRLPEGRRAVSWVCQNQPDLLLVDLVLPDIDGRDVCKEIKLGPRTNLIPVILVTGSARTDDRARGLEVAADDYLTRPFTGTQLQDAIDRVLAQRAERECQRAGGVFRFRLRSQAKYLEELNLLLAALLHSGGFSPEQARQLILAVYELGSNAIEWGHRGRSEEVIQVTCQIDEDKVIFIVRDTGPGFDPTRLPHAARREDPVSHVAVRERLRLREGGFGILLARGLVDELGYNESGNEARIVKHIARRGTSLESCRAG